MLKILHSILKLPLLGPTSLYFLPLTNIAWVITFILTFLAFFTTFLVFSHQQIDDTAAVTAQIHSVTLLPIETSLVKRLVIDGIACPSMRSDQSRCASDMLGLFFGIVVALIKSWWECDFCSGASASSTPWGKLVPASWEERGVVLLPQFIETNCFRANFTLLLLVFLIKCLFYNFCMSNLLI